MIWIPGDIIDHFSLFTATGVPTAPPPGHYRDGSRGVAASRFVGRQDLMACKGLVLTLGSMITIPKVWSM